jgi:heme/copper-type cytochrome/quinol oxidase subunit 2
MKLPQQLTAFVLASALCVLPGALRAEGFANPLGEDMTLTRLLYTILNALILILFPVIIMMIVYTGFLFVVAQGNAQKLQEARRALVWTVIGGAIVLGAVALAQAIQATIEDITQ